MVRYVMDTSAWVEFFRGSLEGKKIKEYLFPDPDGTATLITPTLVITELKSVYIRHRKGDEFAQDLEWIRGFSKIEDKIDEKSAIIAGTKHGNNHTKDNRISYVDCILWTLAEEGSMKILSTDPHFENCPYAIYIKKGENDEI